MSKDIVFIAPNRELYRQTKALASLDCYKDSIDVVLGDLEEGLKKAIKCVEGGTKLVISRGGTFFLLERKLSIPVVELPVTIADLVPSCIQILQLKEPMAIIAYENIIKGFQLASELLPGEVRMIVLSDDSDVEGIVQGCINEGIRLFAGDTVVNSCCEKLGVKCFNWVSSDDSIKASFESAMRLLNLSRREAEMSSRYLTVIDNIQDGIIAVNEMKEVMVVSPSAEKALMVDKSRLLGERITDLNVLPASVLAMVYEDAEFKAELCEVNGHTLSISNYPLMIDDSPKGSVIVIQEVAQLQATEQAIRRKLVEKGFSARYSFNSILFSSYAMEDCILKARQFAMADTAVLIIGETGVGKELFAQSMHNASQRASGPFVAVNCAAISPSLVESELFGYVEGAFTGARKGGRAGFFELAHKGTIFLDEVGELPLDVQGRLLRVIQEHEVMRVGGDRVIPVDVRIISATNRNLRKQVESGKFRKDLYYRINTLCLTIPSLNERRSDIPLLASSFLKLYAKQYGKNIKGFSQKASEYLQKRNYLGNVRELKGIIERGVVICTGTSIKYEDIAEEDSSELLHEESENRTLKQMEHDYIMKVYRQSGGNATKTCSILGISRSTLWRFLSNVSD